MHVPSRKAALLCDTLLSSPALATCVDALTIQVRTPGAPFLDPDGQWNTGRKDGTMTPTSPWPSFAKVLAKMSNLRYLTVLGAGSHSWILGGCSFQLEQLSLDMDWDEGLVEFIETQKKVKDLTVWEYEPEREQTEEDKDMNSDEDEPEQPPPPRLLRLQTSSLCALQTLECATAEAAADIVPGRSVFRLKTSLVCDELKDRLVEWKLLADRLSKNAVFLRSLDLGGSFDDEEEDMWKLERDVLGELVKRSEKERRAIQYLGGLVLPVNGTRRLKFYAFLMRFPNLATIEFDIGSWEPDPTSSFAALRALANELNLYVKSISRVVFLRDGLRSGLVHGGVAGRWREDVEGLDYLWREV